MSDGSFLFWATPGSGPLGQNLNREADTETANSDTMTAG